MGARIAVISACSLTRSLFFFSSYFAFASARRTSYLAVMALRVSSIARWSDSRDRPLSLDSVSPAVSLRPRSRVADAASGGSSPMAAEISLIICLKTLVSVAPSLTRTSSESRGGLDWMTPLSRLMKAGSVSCTMNGWTAVSWVSGWSSPSWPSVSASEGCCSTSASASASASGSSSFSV